MRIYTVAVASIVMMVPLGCAKQRAKESRGHVPLTQTGADWDNTAQRDTVFQFWAGYSTVGLHPIPVQVKVPDKSPPEYVAGELCKEWNRFNPGRKAEICATDQTVVIFPGSDSLHLVDGAVNYCRLKGTPCPMHGGLEVSEGSCR